MPHTAVSLPNRLATPECCLRPWAPAEASELARHADNPNLRRFLWDGFPNPYTIADAEVFLRANAGKPPLDGVYAIEVDGGPVGTIAVHARTDVERLSGEIGYWVSEDYWSRGIATAAVTAVTEAVFEHTELVRVYAPVFSRNVASIRVLEKCGYLKEGVLVRSILKDGVLMDRVLFATTKATALPYEPYRP